VFDKTCDVVAMALRGTANDVDAKDAAALFGAMYGALREAAAGIESAGQKAGF
jgi:hypothetical protein